MWRKKKKLKNRYNSTAGFYNQRYEDIQKRKIREIRKEFKNPEKILDVGCGTGILLEELVKFGDLIVGIDFSNRMLEKAKERVEDVFLVAADADSLPFADNTFDAVISLTLLQNMPNPKETVFEMTRVTEKGGRVIVTALEKKYSVEEVEGWMTLANLKSVKSGKIPESEDVICVGLCEG